MRPAALLAALALWAGQAAALDDPALDGRLDAIARGWAHVNYEIADKRAQAAEADRLAHEAEALAVRYPGEAEPLVWQGILIATEAGAKRGLDGLALAKKAREVLERAEKLNPEAMDGAIYVALGSIYTQAPGFPLGFGDPTKARAYLRKALAVNPGGLDANYAYADLLFRQRDYAGAVRALEQALDAPLHPNREIAERGRRAEAGALLAQARKRLKG